MVWAPYAAVVELIVAGVRQRLARSADGYWLIEPGLVAGTDYQFSLDGGPPLADPRSPFQPYGTDGPSRWVNHAAFAWTDAGWRAPALESGLLYEAHVGTFSPDGTFEGVLERLDHLVRLGVTHLVLMPIAEFGGARGWGYDVTSLYAPSHQYGGPDGFFRLVDRAHARGIAIVLDLVYSHVGPAERILQQFAPYLRESLTTKWGRSFDVDGPDSAPVRAFLLDNIRMWVRDYHVDGIRLDAVHAIHDESSEHVVHEIANAARASATSLGRRCTVLIEGDLKVRGAGVLPMGDVGADGVWAYPFHDALIASAEAAAMGKGASRATKLACAMEDPLTTFRDPLDDGQPIPIVFIEDHDQVANRGAGSRITERLGHDRAELLAAVLMTSAHVPMLFAGQEWGAGTGFNFFTDHRTPEAIDATREGRRLEAESYGAEGDRFDPQDPRAFELSRLDWGEPGRTPHAELLAWYTALATLRRNRDLGVAREHVRWMSPDGDALIIVAGSVVTALNMGPAVVEAPWPGSRHIWDSSNHARIEGKVARIPPGSILIGFARGWSSSAARQRGPEVRAR